MMKSPKNFPASPDVKPPLLHLELTAANEMNIKLKGAGAEISALIVNAMMQRPETVPIFITAVLLWCQEKKVPLSNLQGLADATL
jgi:hypothetical protein